MSHTQSSQYAALVLRVGLGVMFLAHGLLKVWVFTLAGTVGFFESVGLPGWLAYPVTYAEIGAGILLIAGLATRWVALAMLPILAGALAVHWPNGWVFNNPSGGWEYPAFLLLASIAVFLLGDGALAVGKRLGPGQSRH